MNMLFVFVCCVWVSQSFELTQQVFDVSSFYFENTQLTKISSFFNSAVIVEKVVSGIRVSGNYVHLFCCASIYMMKIANELISSFSFAEDSYPVNDTRILLREEMHCGTVVSIRQSVRMLVPLQERFPLSRRLGSSNPITPKNPLLTGAS